MAMRIRRYNAERIAQYGRSRAILDATCHWTLPSGKYSPRITPADAMVINFGVKNRVVVFWKSPSKASIQRHETDPLLSSLTIIEATSCIEKSNATMKAEELS